MSKKIQIDGINNRYLIKKVNHEKLPEKKKNILNEHYSHECQIKIINTLYSNKNDEYNENNQLDEGLKKMNKEVIKKINGYKQQDKKKNVYDEELFIKCEETYEMLMKSELKCNYCCNNIFVLYDTFRDDNQWSLDRINNDIGHNITNVCISCLKCNLQRRNKDYDKFKEGKEIKFIKKLD